MKIERILRAILVVTAIVLVSSLLVLAVSFLRNWPQILVLAGAVAALYGALLLVRRRVRPGTVLEIDLDHGVVERAGSDPVSRAVHRKAVTVRDFVDALGRARGDDRIVGLVVRLGNGGIDVAHAQELREAVHSFRASGKRAVAFAEAFGENGTATVDYYLAVAFDEIYLQPGGLASIEGIVARSPFLRGLFDRLGLVPDFEHRKEYKAAKYLFTETRYTEPHREAIEAVSRDQFAQILSGVAADRGLEISTVESLVDSAPLTAAEALAAGLVDHLGYREEAYLAAGSSSRFIFHDRYLRRAGRPHRKGERVALVYGTGTIERGSSRFDPLTRGSSLGADEVGAAFREAVEDEKVKAIVFRVDSPGGSAVASEVVSHEVDRARESGRPVVVSMANVAGSGGYWVSAGADKIVAQPGTITGSIGVVWGKLASRAAWARLGITFDQVLLGRNATFSSGHDTYSETERERLDVLIDDTYDSFVEHVASARGLSVDQVEEVARGRIWTGAQGHENRLIDALGGLETALALAKEEAGIDRDADVQVVVFPKERAISLPERRDSSEPIRVAADLIAHLIHAGDAAAGPQARMSHR